MASRELKDSELEVLDKYVIALDGIAIIVNNDNPVDNITSEQVKEVFVEIQLLGMMLNKVLC